jgi:hypothetical protein
MKQKLVNAALFIGSIIFSLLPLEVGLRAYKGEWAFINFRFPQGAWFEERHPAAFDAELGWVPKPDPQGPWRPTIAARMAGDPPGTTTTILEDGIRSNGNGEVPHTAESILAVGDSFTFGAQVSDWETWPAQLDKLSGRRVINGGVFGYGIDQAFLRARRLLSRYRVSTVIFSFIPDDIRRCQMSVKYERAKPYFDLKDGRLTLENVPVPPPARPSPKGNGLLVVLEDSWFLIALEHSQLAHSVMIRLFPEWWLTGRMSWETQVHGEEKGKQVACALLHELEGLTKSHGSKLIVVAQHQHGETLAQSMASASVLRCLSDTATRVLDLKPALSELKAKDPSRYNRLYHQLGGHMTAEGNQLVALEISKIVTERGVDPIWAPDSLVGSNCVACKEDQNPAPRVDYNGMVEPD